VCKISDYLLSVFPEFLFWLWKSTQKWKALQRFSLSLVKNKKICKWFQCISQYICQLSVAYLSVLCAPTNLCKKLEFYIFRLLDLGGVPLISWINNGRFLKEEIKKLQYIFCKAYVFKLIFRFRTVKLVVFKEINRIWKNECLKVDKFSLSWWLVHH
jgi:hypothetical protein